MAIFLEVLEAPSVKSDNLTNTERSGKQCEIRCGLVLITNMKSHTGFRFVPKSVTLNYLEKHNNPRLSLSLR